MDTKQFKYEEFTKILPDCPPANYKEVQILAYRFISAETNHPNNFIPAKIQQPSRHFASEVANCLALGLSFFTDKENAKAFFRQRLLKFPRFSAIVGDHLATISINLNDGVASLPAELNFGHFTFHEYILV